MGTRWLVEQEWERMLFAHWRTDPEALACLLPPGVEPDLGFGEAWIGIVAFVMTGTRAATPPQLPVLAPIPELNVRTYVRVHGEPGVWFLSLDASSLFFATVGRVLYGLRYRRARMVVLQEGATTNYSSAAGLARFSARYRPVGPSEPAADGSLAHFLTERYRLFSERGGRLITAEVEHPAWRLSGAEAEIAVNGMAPPGVQLEGEPVLHFSAGVRARISVPERCERLRLAVRGNSIANRRKENSHEHHHHPDHRRARPADPRLLWPRALRPLSPTGQQQRRM